MRSFGIPTKIPKASTMSQTLNCGHSPTTIMLDRAQPVSIETLLQKQKEEKEAAARVSPLQTPQSVLAGSTLTTPPPTAQVPHQGPARGTGARKT